MRKLILASLTISSGVAAQSSPATRPRTAALRGSLEHRLAQLVDAPPFDRATWGMYVVDDRGRVRYRRHADRFSVPASHTELVLTAAGDGLLPEDYRGPPRLDLNRRLRSPGHRTWASSRSRTAPVPCRRTRARPSATTFSGAAEAGASARRGRSRSAGNRGWRA